MAKLESLVGKRFGQLIVLEEIVINKNGNKIKFQKCLCDCGKELLTERYKLKNGIATKCKSCSKIKYYPGQKFGRLTLLYRIIKKDGEIKNFFGMCQCDCGNIKEVRLYDWAGGKTKSCGCLQTEVQSKDFTGQRFGRLLVVERYPDYNGNHQASYLCQCDCGNETIVPSNSLSCGRTTSCGCYAKEVTSKRAREIKGEDHHLWRGGGKFAWFDSYAHQIDFCEDVRRNPEDKNYLQVRCTYCGRWINPTKRQVIFRIISLDGRGTGENRFYCLGDGCRKQCPIFNQQKYPKGYKPATSREVQPELRQLVFLRDNYTCIKCGSTDNLHCHHIEGININPLESSDIDMCITVCKNCHKEIHKQKDCRYIDLKCKKEETNEISA